MKKRFALILALLMFCSCGVQEEPVISEPQSEPEISESSESEPEVPVSSESEPEEQQEEKPEEIPKEKPEFEFEKPEILYPENVPEELFESAAFEEAMNRPSVILYDYEPISDCTAAVNFVEAFEKGEYAELYIYSFYAPDLNGTPSVYVKNSFIEDGFVVSSSVLFFDLEGGHETKGKIVNESIKINEYGYLIYEYYNGVEGSAYKIISDFSLYENFAENLILEEKYIDPVFSLTISPEEFNSASELSEKFIWLFEDIYNYENGHGPWQDFGNNWPVSEILSVLNRYFEGVTKEMLLSARKLNYNSETDSVFYEGGRGGVYLEIRVTSSERNDDILTLCYERYEGENGTVHDGKCILKIRLLSDGSFRYISQEIVESEE